MKILMRLFVGVMALGGLALFGPRIYTVLRYQARIQTVAEAPAARVAVVFGAGLTRSGRATSVLYDRVATAAELFHAGKVARLLLSGDNRGQGYDEPAAMRQVALELGVPDEALVLDPAGRSTYDTCYRARTIYGLDEAVLVTQAFHLPRALFLCESLGVSATGVAADRRPYRERSQAFWNVREIFATAAAVWDVTVARPLPVLGEPQPIQ